MSSCLDQLQTLVVLKLKSSLPGSNDRPLESILCNYLLIPCSFLLLETLAELTLQPLQRCTELMTESELL